MQLALWIGEAATRIAALFDGATTNWGDVVTDIWHQLAAMFCGQ